MPKRFGSGADSTSVQVPGMLGATSTAPQPTYIEKSIELPVAVYKQSTDEKEDFTS